MDFTVNISGTKQLEIDVELDEEVANALDSELSGDVENLQLEDFSTENGTSTITVDAKFTGSIDVTVDESDIEDLVRNLVENSLVGAGIHNFDIDGIEEV